MRNGDNFMREYTVPYDPKTPAQMRQRKLYADAYIAWKGLPSEIKDQYDILADGTKMSGYNLFVRQLATRWN